MDQQRSRATPAAFKVPRFEIGAVLDTVCQRCGGKGHFATECFHIKGEEIQQILSDEEDGPQPKLDVDTGALKEHLKEHLKEEKKHKHKHSKKRKRHSKDKSKKEKKDKKEKDKKKKKQKKH